MYMHVQTRRGSKAQKKATKACLRQLDLPTFGFQCLLLLLEVKPVVAGSTLREHLCRQQTQQMSRLQKQERAGSMQVLGSTSAYRVRASLRAASMPGAKSL